MEARSVVAKREIGDSIEVEDGGIIPADKLSWNPPAPKTIMVELTVEDAVLLSVPTCRDDRLASACRKALGAIKN